MDSRISLAALFAAFFLFSMHSIGQAQQEPCPDGLSLDEGGNCVQWTIVSSGQRPRVHHTATTLTDGRVLLAGGRRTSTSVSEPVSVTDCQLYDPQLRVWLVAGDMNSARSNHTATLLQDGSVLVVGGARLDESSYNNVAISTVERFDPETLTWRSAASLPFPSQNHTATLMNDGRVLFVGRDVLIYDPESDSWSEGPHLEGSVQYGHSAHRLPDGGILIVGGCLEQTPTSFVTYLDPEEISWSARSPTNEPHCAHHSGQLSDGRVVVAGGNSETVEVYESDADSWTTIPDLQVSTYSMGGVVGLADDQIILLGRETRFVDLERQTWELVATTRDYWSGRSATLLDNGDILIVGEAGMELTSTVLSPQTWSFTPSSESIDIHQNSSAVLLEDGRGLVVGGEYYDYIETDAALVFDTTTLAWEQMAFMSAERYDQTATRLLDGRVLVTGGDTYSGREDRAHNSSEIYEPSSNTWSDVPSCRVLTRNHVAALLPSGEVLITGGTGAGRERLDTALVFEPNTDSCRNSSPLLHARSESAAVTLLDGRVVVIGGYGADGSLASAEVFTPSTEVWELFDLDRPMYGNMAVLLDDGRVLLSGGSVDNEIVSDACILDVDTRTCTTVPSMNVARAEHLGALLSDGRVLVVGGSTPQGDTATAEIFDPAENTWTPTAASWAPRRPDSITVLPDGQILVVGGFYISAELFQITTPDEVSP